MPTAYDLQREENLRRNRDLLAALDIDKPLIEPTFSKPQRVKPEKTATSKKRKASPAVDDEDEAPIKALKNSDEGLHAGPRRSARNSGKPTVDYRGEQDRSLPESFHAKKLREADPELGPVGREDGRRLHDP
jgi:E3 ubiquitin-protein ligase UHRF1